MESSSPDRLGSEGRRRSSVAWAAVARLSVPAVLAILVSLGAALRLYGLGHWLRFTGEEATFLLAARDIATGFRFHLLGPEVLNEFGRLGPAYYYLLALPTYLLDGHPLAQGLLTVSVDLGSIVLIYVLARILFGTRAGLIAAALYAVSFVMVFFARWPWHPSLLPFFTLLIMRGVLQVAEGKAIVLPEVALWLALALQMHLSVVVLLAPLAVALWLGRKGLSARIVIYALILGLIPFAPVVLHELRAGFSNTFAVLGLGGHIITQGLTNPLPYLLTSFQVVVSPGMAYRDIPLLPDGGLLRWISLGLVVAAAVVLVRQRRLPRNQMWPLAAWALFPLLVLSLFPGSRADYYLTPWFPVPILLVAFLVNYLWAKGGRQGDVYKSAETHHVLSLVYWSLVSLSFGV